MKVEDVLRIAADRDLLSKFMHESSPGSGDRQSEYAKHIERQETIRSMGRLCDEAWTHEHLDEHSGTQPGTMTLITSLKVRHLPYTIITMFSFDRR